MKPIEITAGTLEQHLEYDRRTAEAVDQGIQAETLYFWEWPSLAVVLGAGGKEEIDVHSQTCRSEGVPILRRKSGGGTVLLGAGCLVFSLILRYERHPALRDVNASYRWILGRFSRCLSVFAPVQMAGICDLITGGKKFSGNAQHRKRNALLHHGTILYQFPLELMARYLNTPERQPEYRQGRPHFEFVTNFPASKAELMQTILQEFSELFVAGQSIHLGQGSS